MDKTTAFSPVYGVCYENHSVYLMAQISKIHAVKNQPRQKFLCFLERQQTVLRMSGQHHQGQIVALTQLHPNQVIIAAGQFAIAMPNPLN